MHRCIHLILGTALLLTGCGPRPFVPPPPAGAFFVLLDTSIVWRDGQGPRLSHLRGFPTEQACLAWAQEQRAMHQQVVQSYGWQVRTDAPETAGPEPEFERATKVRMHITPLQGPETEYTTVCAIPHPGAK